MGDLSSTVAALATPARRRLAVAIAAAGVVVAGTFAAAEDPRPAQPVPEAECGPGSLPEGELQGRVPAADYTSGRVVKGYTCNTEQISHHGSSGGLKTQRYVDPQGNQCAYYDSTLMLGLDIANGLVTGNGLGVVTLDMNDPAKPRKTANLVSPAMLSPHESLLVNQERGLLVAVMGNLLTAPGILDVYDISADCRKPKLLSTTLSGVFGHESGFAPDGLTFWTAGAASTTMAAVDLTNPRRPKTLATFPTTIMHGVRFSDDGRTMYGANMGRPSGNSVLDAPSLAIYDVSEVQDRKPKPAIHKLSELDWADISIPQVAEPFTRDGRHYVLEVDEFTDLFGDGWKFDMTNGSVGAARIIDVDDPEQPVVVSDLRLEVHQKDVRSPELMKDPGAALPIQGYAAHYCSVPTRDNPRLVACSMMASGLRIFDISDLANPVEVAYFNKPIRPGSKLLQPIAAGAWAMSQPSWDPANDAVWFSDANSGFYAVRLTNGVEDLLD